MLTEDTLDELARGHVLFAQLPPSLRRTLAAEAALVQAPAGTPLFHAGAPCGAFPLVLAGSVRVAHAGPDGRELTLYRVAPGELCVLSSSARLVDLMHMVDAVAFRRLDQRLAALLLERGPHVATTHQRLAADLGSVREFVTRVLDDFQDRGLVQLSRGGIDVRDAEGLRRVGA